MSKHSFDRDQGILREEYEDSTGKKHVMQIAAALVGEELGADDRSASLADIESPVAAQQFRGVYALGQERSPEVLERLLAALEAGSEVAPNALLPYVGDSRVRPALLGAVARIPGEKLANFAQALALAGGEGAADVLRHRLDELANDPMTFRDDPFFNRRAGSLAVLAAGLLRLGSAVTVSAGTLVGLLGHACVGNRQFAAREAVDALQLTLQVEVRDLLRMSLVRFLDADDAQLFGTVARALIDAHLDHVLQRCESMLGSPYAEQRSAAVRVLGAMTDPGVATILLRHLPQEPELRVACSIVRALRDQVPVDLRTGIVRRALANESPSVRLEGVGLLSLLDAFSASSMAQEALADEPEPLLQARLQRIVNAGN